ncbi:MAG TPA: cytochrome c [Ignavibacteria bacterium]|nr:cytochrome c [Ignavibacteria bacterium]
MKNSILILSLGLLFFIGCSKVNDKESENQQNIKDTGTTQNNQTSKPDSKGKEIFYMKSEVNNIACADCHSDGTNTSNSLTAYFSDVIGANKRESTYLGKFKGSEVSANAGGATVCWKTYMKYKTDMTPDQISDLNVYFESLLGSGTPVVSNYETIALPKRDKEKLKPIQTEIASLKGDENNGKIVFDKACVFCHNQDSKIKKVPDVLDEFEGNVKSVTYNVYLGDGPMPFYHLDKLSGQDIADITAYLLTKK